MAAAVRAEVAAELRELRHEAGVLGTRLSSLHEELAGAQRERAGTRRCAFRRTPVLTASKRESHSTERGRSRTKNGKQLCCRL
jgi:ABC-type thiamine transport system ATPase subunit